MKEKILYLLKYLFSLKLKRFYREIRIIIDTIKYEATKGSGIILSYPPRHITLLTNGQCTNKCTFCVHHSLLSKDSFSKHLYKPNYKITFEQFKNIVDKSYSARVPYIHLCAMGEPTLHKEFFNFVDYTIKKYGFVSFQTNFNEKLFKKRAVINEIIKRKNKIKYITTDILSADKEQHNKIKKGSDFDYIIESLNYISKNAPKIKFHLHLILTKYNYKNIDKLVQLLSEKKINGQLDVVNLHPYKFKNDPFTSLDAVYKTSDYHIKKELDKAVKVAKKVGFKLNIPKPFDTKGKRCNVFWSRMQVNFVLTENREIKYGIGNCLPGDCNAVVRGNLRSIGNIIEAKNIWEVWNGKLLRDLRSNILDNKYPDEECKNCQNYIA